MIAEGVRHFPRSSVTVARTGSPNRTCDFPVVTAIINIMIRPSAIDFNMIEFKRHRRAQGC